MTPGIFRKAKRRSSRIAVFFAWQMDRDYRQWVLIKIPVFWQE